MRSIAANLYIGHQGSARYLEAEAAGTGLRAVDALVLRAIARAEGRATARHLGEALGQSPSTTSAIVSRLARHGYVSAAADPFDRRFVSLRTSTTGRTAAGIVESALTAMDRALYGSLTAEEIEALENVVDAVSVLASTSDRNERDRWAG